MWYRSLQSVELWEKKKGNVLFKDALNTFLQLYGVNHKVKNHSDNERGNPLPSHGLLFPISSKVYFIIHHPTDKKTHTTVFVTPVVEHWLEREISSIGPPRRIEPKIHRTMSERSYHGATSRTSTLCNDPR